MNFDIELDRQVVQVGDELIGWLTVEDQDVESVEIAFQGEETLGANDVFSQRVILPVADERLTIDARGGLVRKEFRIKVPDDASPTYASRNVRCQYGVKATIARGFWRRNISRKLDVTVMPSLTEGLTAMPEEVEVEHGDLRLIARLDQNVVLTGDSLSGSLYFEKKTEDAQLPTKLSFRLAAIEESSEKGYPHREILTLDTHEVIVDTELHLPFTGFFDFPIHEAAEPSGTWNLFKVHYGFRVTFYDQLGKDHRSSTMVRVVRDMKPWVEKEVAERQTSTEFLASEQ